MSSGPPTSRTLIASVQQQQEGAWERFVEVYEPAISAFLRAKGVQDADADDILQETLRGVAKGIANWQADPQRGTFHNWLFTLTRRKLVDFWRRQAGQPQGSGDTEMQVRLDAVEDHRSDADIWNLEYERRLFQYAAQQVSGEVDSATWQAFWLTAVAGETPSEVASKLGIRVGSVYVARTRVMRRLRDRIAELDDQLTGDGASP